jgi:hypothetical protein
MRGTVKDWQAGRQTEKGWWTGGVGSSLVWRKSRESSKKGQQATFSVVRRCIGFFVCDLDRLLYQ